MSSYTPITITPLNPAGPAVILPMPESVESTANTVSFEFLDPMDASGQPVDLPTLAAPALTGSPERIQHDIRRDGKRQVQSDPPARLVEVQWAEIEHYSAVQRSYTAIGALVLAAKRYNKSASEGASISLILYRADAIWTAEGVLEL